MKSILMHVKAADSLRQARKVPFSAEKEERELPNSAQESKGWAVTELPDPGTPAQRGRDLLRPTLPANGKRRARTRRNPRTEMRMLSAEAEPNAHGYELNNSSAGDRQTGAAAPILQTANWGAREDHSRPAPGNHESWPTILPSNCLTRGFRNFGPH